MCCHKHISKQNNFLFISHQFLLLVDSLITRFDNHFNDFRKHESQFNLFINPFTADYNNYNNYIRNQVIMLRQNSNLKQLFKSTNINHFYSRLSQEFIWLKQNAFKIITFSQQHMIVNNLFSIMNLIKTKQTNRISDKLLEARLQIFSAKDIKPNIEQIMTKPRYNKSH